MICDRPYLIRARLEITLLINQPLVCVIMSKTTNIRTPEGVVLLFYSSIYEVTALEKKALDSDWTGHRGTNQSQAPIIS